MSTDQNEWPLQWKCIRSHSCCNTCQQLTPFGNLLCTNALKWQCVCLPDSFNSRQLMLKRRVLVVKKYAYTIDIILVCQLRNMLHIYLSILLFINLPTYFRLFIHLFVYLFYLFIYLLTKEDRTIACILLRPVFHFQPVRSLKNEFFVEDSSTVGFVKCEAIFCMLQYFLTSFGVGWWDEW